MTKNNRIDGIDVLKALAMFWVITLHADLWLYDIVAQDYSTKSLFYYAFRLAAEGVPVFITVNGFLLFRKSTFDLKKHLLKTGKLILLLFIWAFILASYQAFINNNFSIPFVLLKVLDTHINSEYTGVLWYIQGLASAWLLFPIFKYVHDNNKKIYRYIFYVVAFFTLGLRFINFVVKIIALFVPADYPGLIVPLLNRMDPLDRDQNDNYVFFMLLGGMIADNEERIKEKRSLLVPLGIAAWIASFFIAKWLTKRYGYLHEPSFNYCSIFTLFMMLGYFAFALGLPSRDSLPARFIKSLGKNSLGVYFLHIIVLITFRFIINKTPWQPEGFWYRLLTVVSVYIISWGITLLLSNIPVIKKLVTL